MTRTSSAATSRPNASAWRSTVLGAMASPASSRSRVLAPAKLVRAAVMPSMRTAVGDRPVPSIPSARVTGAEARVALVAVVPGALEGERAPARW